MSDAMGAEKTDTLLPLANLVVLDLTLARAGPTCVRHLSDWGASVIRVEPPSSGGDVLGSRDGPDFQNLHRNKRTIQLDLKTASGHAAFLRLVATADVLVENMRANVKHRLGIAWEDLHLLNERLVYGSISGFGQDGPYAERAGVDQIAQGMGGLMSVTGLPGQGPTRTGVAIADLTAGNLLAFGIMTALFERHRTGKGRWVTTSLLEAQVFMLDFQAARWLMRGEIAGQVGNDHATGIPGGVFPTADSFISMAASSDRIWKRFCETIGRPEWLTRPDWSDHDGRSLDRAAINSAISDITRTKPTAYWTELLNEAGIPCGPIYSVDQVFADPQVQHLGIAMPVEHPRLGEISMIASPLNLSGVNKQIRSPTPDMGADTDAVLTEAGLTQEEITRMRAEGAI